MLQALIQRVSQARVEVSGELVGEIQHGLLVLLGVERKDDAVIADKMLHKLLHYRVFADAEGKMNCNVKQVQGGLLLVSQFTLAADTHKGLRPSFSCAASPDQAEELYNYLVAQARQHYGRVEQGRFAADMQVHLVNDGPVTFLLQC